MFTVYQMDSCKRADIYSSEELRDAVFDTIQYYEEANKRLREENRNLIESAKQVVRKDYEEQISDLNERLKLSYGEFASEKELQAYKDFTNRHMHNRAESKANGGLAPYIIPHYTGIGCIKKVVCQICGESEDITDTEAW